MLRESVWFAHISKLKCCETGFKTQLGFASKVLNHHVVLQKKNDNNNNNNALFSKLYL